MNYYIMYQNFKKNNKNKNKNKNKYEICKDKRDGISGCRDCCKRYFINYQEYKKCVKVCMNN